MKRLSSVLIVLIFSCSAASADETICLPLSETQNAVKDLQVCKERAKELDLCKGVAEKLETSNEMLVRDYQGEIEKTKAAEEKLAGAPLRNWIYFGLGVLSTSAAVTLAGKLK